MDELSIPTKELAARIEKAAIDHPLSTDMRDYIRVAIARLRAYDRHLEGDTKLTHFDYRQSASTPLYPCDRGIPNGPRGLHEFLSLPGGVPTCRYCGATARKGWA